MKRMFIIMMSALLLSLPVAASAAGKGKEATATYRVNMHCKDCVEKLTDNLSYLKGVKDFKISLDKKTVTITYDPSKTDESRFVKVISKLGYTAEKIPEETAAASGLQGNP